MLIIRYLMAVMILQCIVSTAYSQYVLDLQKVGAPAIADYLTMGNPGLPGQEIRVNNLYMTIGNKPVLPVMGEIHFSRYDCRFWKDALLKMKASGVTIVATYVLWNYHEEIEGRLEWTGNNNLREFISLCGELGLLVHLRCGPYCNAETRNGGLPDWLSRKGAKPRTNDPLYLAYARKWYRDVYAQVRGLLYKDGGPIMALQIENEYVTKELLLSHMLNLKSIAVEEGFDVPLYSMTHWMSVDYPKGEIVPYAGYYIETPWINSGKNELPVSNFQFFNYNRISDNIGTDIIKNNGNSETLISEDNTSPYFTCEVGLGTPAFYNRRAIVPEEMAGANINLRLGCGVNLMGYYMYVGGSNRVGEITTLESSGGRVSYDYQAPIREFGNWGAVMKETRKYNYFMNDFGANMAPAIAWLPTSNKDTTNLQWAVRLNKNDGFLFCSNYLYKHARRDYEQVQFKIDLPNERLTIPRHPVTIRNGAYFAWAFNQNIGNVLLKYATSQLICKHTKANIETFFFFADDEISPEYLIEEATVRNIKVLGGKAVHEKNGYFISQLVPGKDCIIEITKKDGKTVRLITLTEKESDEIWKGKINGREFVAFTESGLIFDDSEITLIDELPKQEISVYESDFSKTGVKQSNYYTKYLFEDKQEQMTAGIKKLLPMNDAYRITPKTGNVVQKIFDGATPSAPEQLLLRCKAAENVKCYFNNTVVPLIAKGNYSEADITSYFISGENSVRFESTQSTFSIIAEIEVLLKNGNRWIWQTDNTWVGTDKHPVTVIGRQGENANEDIAWNGNERMAYYEIATPNLRHAYPEVRLNIGFSGDLAEAYIGGKLVNDFLFNGSDWIIGINRYSGLLAANPLLIRIRGFNTEDPPVYFEKNTDLKNCMTPVINHVNVKKEYRFKIH